MFKNYFYLTRCSFELIDLLKEKKIEEVYSQEKNKLYFKLIDLEYSNAHLIISTTPPLPYFLWKKEHNKAKKNTVNFFGGLLPDKIENVAIAKFERIVKLKLTGSEIYFVVRGGQTNVFLFANGKIVESFKKVDDKTLKSFQEEITNLKFVDTAAVPDFNELLSKLPSYKEVKNTYPFIDRGIYNEVKVLNENSQDAKKHFKEVINKIYSENIKVGMSKIDGKPVFYPETFTSIETPENEKGFENFNDALQYYIGAKFRKAKVVDSQKEIGTYLDKELGKLSSKLNKLKSRIENGSKSDIYKQTGDLLLTNIYKIKKGMKEIEVEDFDSGESIKIKLDEKLPPQKNIDKFYEKSHDEKVNYEKSKELYGETEKEYRHLLSLKNSFDENSSNPDILDSLKKELKLEKKSQMDIQIDDRINFRHFIVDNKYHVFVGKDSKSNDLLTTKFAKQNDLWFHARGMPGSHVVLRVENKKEAVPKSVIKTTACLTAFYSKAKTAGLVPVAYTFAKYVRKRKGMEPGQVIMTKEEVLIVKPEIPKNCKPA